MQIEMDLRKELRGFCSSKQQQGPCFEEQKPRSSSDESLVSRAVVPEVYTATCRVGDEWYRFDWHGEVNCSKRRKTGWWFQTFFIFHNIWDNFSHWLSYFSRWLLHHQPVLFTGWYFLNQKPRSWISWVRIWNLNNESGLSITNPIFSGKIIQIWVGFALQSNFIDWMVSIFFVDHNVVEGPVFMIFT